MRRVFPLVLVLLVACVPTERDAFKDVHPPTPVAGAHTGGAIRIGITPPDGIDPTGAHEPSGELIASTMCDQLIAFDPRTGEPRPSLAKSWTVGDGGRNVFVKLRSDARFSDGSPVTVEDVAFTLARLADEEFASPSASLIEDVAGYGFVHGEDESRDESVRRNLVGVGIVDQHTLSIALTGAHSEFIRVLGHPATSPVPRALVQADPAAFARSPVCAGPYRLDGPPATGGPIVLTRVEDYAGVNNTLARSGAGYVDKIEFDVFPTRAAAAAAFRKGKLDVAQVPAEDRRAAPSGAREVVTPTLQTEFIGLPTTKKPFDDARVRRALNLALDRERISALFDSRRIAAAGFLPGAECSPALKPDVAGAGALLVQADVDARKVALTLFYNDEFQNKALVAEVARQWRAVLGLRVTLQSMLWDRYRALATRAQGLDGAFRFGWAPPVPASTLTFEPLFTIGGIGKDNWSLYSSRDLNDTLRDLNEGSAETDRAREQRRAHDILCTDMPMIPVVRETRVFLVRSAVQGATGTGGQLLTRELFVTS
jgi:oligopeptide transport system substrate-binding protein